MKKIIFLFIFLLISFIPYPLSLILIALSLIPYPLYLFFYPLSLSFIPYPLSLIPIVLSLILCPLSLSFIPYLLSLIPNSYAQGLKTEKIHKVSNGDTLWGIATKYYGDGFKWGKIYNRNLDIIKNPDLIYPGMEIKLPEIEEIVLPKSAEEKKDEIIISTNNAVNTQNISEVKSTQTASLEVKLQTTTQVTIENNTQIEKNIYEILNGLDLSEDMPQTQLSSPIIAKTIKVDESFFDGKVISKESEDEIEKEGLVNEGDKISVELYNKDFKAGDKIIMYKKGVALDDKFTAQYAGIAKIVEIQGKKAICIVLKVNNSIDNEVLVKKFEK